LILSGNTFSVDQTANDSLIPNSDFQSGLTGWSVYSNGVSPSSTAGTVVTNAGEFVFQNNALQTAWISSDTRIPVSPGIAYTVSGRFRRADNNVNNNAGLIYLAVRAFDSTGNNIGGSTDGGTWFYHPVNALSLSSTDTSWHSFAADVGGEFGRALPANAVTITVGAILNYNSGNRTYQVTDLQINRADPPRTPIWRTLSASGQNSLSNGWINYNSAVNDPNTFNPFGYFKDANGMVHLRGLIRNGTPAFSTPIFTLPPGFRPAFRQLASTISNDGVARVDIAVNGDIFVALGSTAWTSLDNISFAAQQ